jgi:hypothetical protein
MDDKGYTHAMLTEMHGLFCRFYRKVTGNVQILLIVCFFFFHGHLFQCTINVLMTFDVTYILYRFWGDPIRDDFFNIFFLISYITLFKICYW